MLTIGSSIWSICWLLL